MAAALAGFAVGVVAAEPVVVVVDSATVAVEVVPVGAVVVVAAGFVVAVEPVAVVDSRVVAVGVVDSGVVVVGVVPVGAVGAAGVVAAVEADVTVAAEALVVDGGAESLVYRAFVLAKGPARWADDERLPAVPGAAAVYTKPPADYRTDWRSRRPPAAQEPNSGAAPGRGAAAHVQSTAAPTVASVADGSAGATSGGRTPGPRVAAEEQTNGDRAPQTLADKRIRAFGCWVLPVVAAALEGSSHQLSGSGVKIVLAAAPRTAARGAAFVAA